jgi:hypothetical protein
MVKILELQEHEVLMSLPVLEVIGLSKHNYKQVIELLMIFLECQ